LGDRPWAAAALTIDSAQARGLSPPQLATTFTPRARISRRQGASRWSTKSALKPAKFGSVSRVRASEEMVISARQSITR
jgi:hypothetical protein